MDQEPTQKYLSATQWVPSTFEERGAAVPFTTPSLACSRVRPDERHALVLLASRFAETKSVYVLPWGALPQVVSMTLHDRALHEAVQMVAQPSPATVRKEALVAAASGLAGPEVQESAKASIEEERLYADEIHCVLILYLLRDLGSDVSSLLSQPLVGGGAVSAAKTALQQAIEPLELDPETLYSRVGLLAETLTPIGLGTYGRFGRLRRLLSELVEFRNDMNRRFTGDDSEADDSYAFAGEVALHTIVLAESIIRQLDTNVLDLPQVIRGWDRRYPEIQRLASRASWLLDGWDYAIAFARPIDSWRRDELWANLETLTTMLPLIPRDEGKEEDGASGSRFAELTQRKRVGSAEDWRTGRIDLELRRRLELAKAAALAPRATLPVPAMPAAAVLGQTG